jgi:hypothetical protein
VLWRFAAHFKDLIQLHLIGSVDAGDGQWSSPVVAALPTSRLGDMQQEEGSQGGSEQKWTKFLMEISITCI